MNNVVSNRWIVSEGDTTRAVNVGQSGGLGSMLPSRLASRGVTMGRNTNGCAVSSRANQKSVLTINLALVSELSRRDGGAPKRLRLAARNDLGCRRQSSGDEYGKLHVAQLWDRHFSTLDVTYEMILPPCPQ